MTKLLERALKEAAKLPADEQDALGRVLLEELASERRWEELFAGSHELLADLADEALAEHRAAGPRSLIRTNCDLRKLFAELPTEVQRQARRVYRVFRQNPNHPSLRFKAGSSYSTHLFRSD